ncbi:DEAD/DEAH box helicase [Pseudovibrio exalbescens]|uniref:RNA helicase n=1 Tax=Pseudovibrio exalbescens TaxID=197461 RepID=A0A1U7JL45_9HYPH|nr:DEAD/DEAH box helicase [Pseudovibrio exalbescens]OKL45449.1 RNA helicase [Pseudovibrio exalbescens]
MSDFYQRLAHQIEISEGYEQASQKLFDAYVDNLSGQECEVSQRELKQLLSAIQVFYKSELPSHVEEGAILLSMLLDLFGQKFPQTALIANNIFVNSGDFPNIDLIRQRYPDLQFRLSFYTEAQMEFRQKLNTVEQLSFPLTDYQRSLWTDLSSGCDLITSAPTSAGKTFIILNYLVEEVKKSEGAFVAIIVPTRALISEVAAQIYELVGTDTIEVCTVPRGVEFSDKTFFVMTQERLHELLLQGDITFNYLFIDEAHNISDKSRGVLLHLTIQRLLEDSFPQIIISMPSQAYLTSFSSIFSETEFKQKITTHSPVAKILMNVVPKGRDLLISRQYRRSAKRIPKGFSGTRFADIVFRLGQGDSNIVYRNRTSDCEKMANEIAELVKTAKGADFATSDELEEAAGYIEHFVHDKFSLAENLRHGVAFHYGPLPPNLRTMIEGFAKEGKIDFIVCTGTLAEGVNLPAKNLFLNNPAQLVQYAPPERIEDVKVRNITGRAGRMMRHFSGNIFLVKPDEWNFTDYFDKNEEEKQQIPTYFKTLNEELELVLEALNGRRPSDENDQYRIYTIANKLIKEYERDGLSTTLSAKELNLSDTEKRNLSKSAKAAFKALKVTSFTLEANPTIGYIQQNRLFSFLENLEAPEEWKLPHPKSADLYRTLLRISEKLRECGVYVPTDGRSLERICWLAQKWLQGNSLKEIIAKRIEWEIEDKNKKAEDVVNGCVRNVIKTINNDITFRLANALKCYQILSDNVLAARGIDELNFRLHTLIEIGACDERMINLINLGLSRDAAKEIDVLLPSTWELVSSSDLARFLKDGALEDLHPITEKEVRRLLNEDF